MRISVFACALVLVAAQAPASLSPCAASATPSDRQTTPPQQRGQAGAVDRRATTDRDQTKGTAVIRGRVLGADTGRPLRHASISVASLMTDTGETRQFRGGYTDENGQFECKDLVAGKYQLRASLIGYVALAFGENLESGGAREIELADGATFDKADFRLPKAGAVTGRVVDDGGEPLEGVQVQAFSVEYVGGSERLRPVGSTQTAKRTNDVGRYRIFGLEPGEYYVAATPGAFNSNSSANGDMAPGYMLTYYPGAPDLANAQKVTVSAGQETQADFGVVPTRAFDISGVAVDATGRPLATTMVMLSPGTSASLGVSARTATDPDGAFRFVGIAPGPYTLQVQPAIGLPPPPGSAPGAPTPAPQFASMFVTVVGNMSNVMVQARPGRTATFDILTDGTPPSFTITSVLVRARPVDFTRSPAVVGTEGRNVDEATKEMRNLWGPCIIEVSAPGGWTLKAVRAGGADVTDRPIDFDRDPGRIQIVLTNAVTDVSGNVTDEGRVAARVPVVVFPADSRLWDFQSRFIRRTTTDENGHFAIARLPAGDYRAIALSGIRSGNAWQHPSFLESLLRDASRLTLHDAEHATIDLRLTRNVSR